MGEHAEAKVFEQLKLVSDRYDVFTRSDLSMLATKGNRNTKLISSSHSPSGQSYA